MKRLLLLSAFFAQPAVSADQALRDCRDIADIAERVACYDEVVDAERELPVAGDVREAVATTRKTEVKESDTRAKPDPEKLFGTSDTEAKRIMETSLAIEQLDRIEAVVTDVRLSATKKLTVTLDNGQSWRQLDNRSLRLGIGEAVIVRKASLGSFLLQKQSGSRSIRVKRAN